MEKYGDGEEKYEARIPRFYITPDEDFNFWSMRFTTALRGRELAAALTNNNVYSTVNERAFAIIVAALGNSPFRAIQDCKTTKSDWTKLQSGYSGKPMTNKHGLIPFLFNLKISRDTVMGDHISYLQSVFAKLQIIRINFEVPLVLALYMYSLSDLSE